MAKPKCLECEKKTAKNLNLPIHGGEETYFCTLKCAATYAMSQVLLTTNLCTRHGWYQSDDGCEKCVNELKE